MIAALYVASKCDHHYRRSLNGTEVFGIAVKRSTLQAYANMKVVEAIVPIGAFEVAALNVTFE